MNTKTLSLIVFALVWILSACSPASVATPSEELPEPVIAGEGYQALQIADVHVEVGTGSPIPVHVNVSGSLPDTCAQVEYSEIRQDGRNFLIVNVNGAAATFDLRTVPANQQFHQVFAIQTKGEIGKTNERCQLIPPACSQPQLGAAG
ncbi:MAG TPA: hypothetical protein VFH34_14795 [Anaerolineales bacterium]|nr:hypothetical protein [Anaerolineales bacterium]